MDDSLVFFRLDMTVRTWATAPFARGSSWFCGWKESSLRWPPLTWGSRCPSSARNASWASGRRELSHRNSTNEWNEAAFERFLSVIQAISHWRLSKGVLRLSPVRGSVYKELSVAVKQTPPFNWVYRFALSQGHYWGANKIRKLWRRHIIEWFIMYTQSHTDAHTHSARQALQLATTPIAVFP